jgi:tRNA A-37 threonylcarbamoyl transferase component Bud32
VITQYLVNGSKGLFFLDETAVSKWVRGIATRPSLTQFLTIRFLFSLLLECNICIGIAVTDWMPELIAEIRKIETTVNKIETTMNQELGNVNQELGHVNQKLLHIAKGPTPSLTPADFGGRELKRLKEANLFITLEEKVGQPSVLKASEATRLAEIADEHCLVAFLTTYLEDVFKETGYSIVNSEEYGWVETGSRNSKSNLKPDLLLCHDSIYATRPPSRPKGEMLNSMRKETYKFGVLKDWRLRKCIGATLEAKLKIDNQGFGEVLNYGAHICFNNIGDTSAPVHTRLILFDRFCFWLVDCARGSVSGVKTCGWTMPGSRKCLADFYLQDDWMKLLKCACLEFKLEVMPNAFLGAGAFGLVFSVHRQGCEGRKLMALKLVNTANVLRLAEEQGIMIKAKLSCPDLVVGVEVDGFASFDDLGGALLLSDVGEAVPKTCCNDLITLLAQLHEQNIIHGDPRIQNAVSVSDDQNNNKLMWIDFLESPGPLDSKRHKQNDMKILLASLGVPEAFIKGVLETYTGTVEQAKQIAASVWCP